MEDNQDWIKAGKIAGEALQYAKRIAKPGINLLELADNVELKIVELGGTPAFPVNLSLNYVAAHYAPVLKETIVLKETDILKIDVGVHVNGAIGDTALTIRFDHVSSRATAHIDDGRQLAAVVGYWFAWYAFNPHTAVFRAGAQRLP